MSPSNLTFIGGMKAFISNIVTEFACERAIVAVAPLRSPRCHRDLRRSRKHEWPPSPSLHMAIFRRES